MRRIASFRPHVGGCHDPTATAVIITDGVFRGYFQRPAVTRLSVAAVELASCQCTTHVSRRAAAGDRPNKMENIMSTERLGYSSRWAVSALALLAVLGGCGEANPVEVLAEDRSTEALEQSVSDSLLDSYLEDASRLALREVARKGELAKQPVEIPEDLTLSLYRALLLVHSATDIAARDSVVNLYRIHTFPRPATRQLIVGLESSAEWAQAWREGKTETGNARIDALLRRYDLSLERFYDWSTDDAAVLQAAAPLNIAALAAEFAPLAGVRYAEPNGYGGDGNDIGAERIAGAWRLAYSLGFGDCPAGCISRHFWTFEVSDAGNVTYLGSSGDPITSHK